MRAPRQEADRHIRGRSRRSAPGASEWIRASLWRRTKTVRRTENVKIWAIFEIPASIAANGPQDPRRPGAALFPGDGQIVSFLTTFSPRYPANFQVCSRLTAAAQTRRRNERTWRCGLVNRLEPIARPRDGPNCEPLPYQPIEVKPQCRMSAVCLDVHARSPAEAVAAQSQSETRGTGIAPSDVVSNWYRRYSC